MAPRSRISSLRHGATRRTRATPSSACPTTDNAVRLAEFLAGDEPTVVYFGKLIEQKGVQILLEAMQHVDARLVVVGFGPHRSRSSGWRRGARSSPGRSSIVTSCTCCRWPT